MGDPGFVGSLARGRSLRLRTADRALAFMGRPPLEPLLKAEVEAFLAVSGTKASVLGEEALGDRAFVGRLRRGASPHLETFDRVRAWMAANATEDELRAVRGRLAGVADSFKGIQAVTGKSGAGEGPREEGNHLDTREAAARLGLSPKHARALPRERRGTGVSEARLPGALPARRHRGVGLGAALEVPVRRERRAEEEGALGARARRSRTQERILRSFTGRGRMYDRA